MIIVIYQIYLMNCRFNSIEGFEGTAQSLGGVDDTNAINTLAQIAKNLMAGGVTVPGNMIVKGGSIATGDAPGQTPGTIISNMGDSWGMLWGSHCALIGQKGKPIRFGFADAFNAAGWDEKVTIQPDGTLIAKSNMNVGGTTTTPVLNLGGKFRLSGAGDAHGNDDWLRLFGVDNKNYYGGLAAGRLYTADNTINGRNIFAELDDLRANAVRIDRRYGIQSGRTGFLSDRGGWQGKPTQNDQWESMRIVPQ